MAARAKRRISAQDIFVKKGKKPLTPFLLFNNFIYAVPQVIARSALKNARAVGRVPDARCKEIRKPTPKSARALAPLFPRGRGCPCSTNRTRGLR